MKQGLLGGNVYKKRVGLVGRGKRDGVRTLLAYKEGNHVFLIYGYAKNQKDNISATELKALKLLSYSMVKLRTLTQEGELIEVKTDG